MNWIIVFIAFAGVILNIKKHWFCFLLWLISNGYWFVYNIRIGEFAQASIYGVFFILSIYGLFSWRKKAAAEKGIIKHMKNRLMAADSLIVITDHKIKKLKTNQKKVKQFCRELLAMKTQCKTDGRVKINGLFDKAIEILEDIK